MIGAQADLGPEVLDVPGVMARYHLRDRRSARRVMDAAGAFVIGGRLLVRANDLREHEERLRDERRGAAQEEQQPRERDPGRVAPHRSGRLECMWEAQG